MRIEVKMHMLMLLVKQFLIVSRTSHQESFASFLHIRNHDQTPLSLEFGYDDYAVEEYRVNGTNWSI